MTKYQLWSRDEYGQNQIHATKNNIEDVFKKGEQLLKNDNIDNALTNEEKKDNWESYMVVFDNNDYYYAGKPITKHMVIDIRTDKVLKMENIIDKNIPKIYCGEFLDGKNSKKWFATNVNHTKEELIKIDSPELENKVCYFIKKV